MKLAVCQMNVVQGKKVLNREKAAAMIQEAAEQKAQVVVLPEMWLTGYDFGNLQEHVESLEDETFTWLREQAKEYQIWLVGGSYMVKQGEKVYNTSLTFAPDGQLINLYHKIHLIGLMEEDRYLARGDIFQSFTMNGHRAAVIICYDLRFPELARSLAIEGASLLIVPAQWPVQREDHWLTLLKARAIENQMYVVGANVTGRNEKDEFHGKSVIYDPWGEVVQQAGKEETILLAELAMDKVEEIRQKMPVFADRVPHIYRLKENDVGKEG